MTTQYGFFIDSSRCTGCKTCELACKDYKDLTPEVSFRRIYEYAGGDWQEDNGVWHQKRVCLLSVDFVQPLRRSGLY
ncbi:anaerobic dimethyl sulfoxide reductase subunit B [Escherichia coli]|nr:anaerobic dimethyl sulfoxide reductase subunit B [Escherichia coli]